MSAQPRASSDGILEEASENQQRGAAPAKAVFTCDLCGEPAVAIELVPKGVPHPDALRVAPAGTFVWTGFIGHCREIVTDDQYAALQTAVLKCSPRAIYDVNKLWAPFYCPECDLSYCIKHWSVEPVYDDDPPGWYDCMYGTCPKGHRRLIDD